VNERTGSSPRLLIFVVAYHAETTLERVLERLPPSVFEMHTRVLVIDDSSTDRTFEAGLRASAASRFPIEVRYNPRNQGYGGNQKLGYAYAINEGFDHVVLLHGDGQYAPESMPELLEPLLAGRADAVLGSRMLRPGAARRGGMPLYKWLGNRVLTRFQNLVLRTRLSEFHTGYRAYRVEALRAIPFERNTNDFHFDTQILIQLLRGGFRIVEVPIPTYYGDEICRVNGMRYAANVAASTLRSRLHDLGIFYERKYDLEEPGENYQPKLDYPSSHSLAIGEVAAGSRVVDVACGPGEVARALSGRGCRVVGYDQRPPRPGTVAEFRRADLDAGVDFDLEGVDYVLLLDILEHLRSPEAMLDRLRAAVRDARRPPRFVISTGNVAFLPLRIQLLLGQFNYGRRGILDITHKRLLTFRSLRKLLHECGYEVLREEGVPAPFPLALGGLNRLSRFLLGVNRALIKISRGLFAYQIFVVARPLPTVDALLREGGEATRAKKTAAGASAR
jgi:glycosyltransferase involved in cell wall biosynthesis